MTVDAAPPFARGIWCVGGDPRTVAAVSRLGADWVAIDLQHGAFDDASMRAALGARRDDAVPVWVRVLSTDPAGVGRALDAGAAGVIVPLVDDAAIAERLAAAVRYPPVGTRSSGPATTAAPHVEAPELAVMIETEAGLASVDAIAAVPGVDMLFVGPVDLALALGRSVDALLAATDADDPLPRIVRAARAHGIRTGAFGGSPARARELGALGFESVAVITDDGLLQLGGRAALGD